MWNILEDLPFGKNREKLVVSYLNENIYFEDKMRLYSNPGSQVDFRNSKIIGELKSRTCIHTTYPETFFGYNKIKYLKELNDSRDWKFYFLFTDGLYEWTYKKGEYRVDHFEHQERGLTDQVYVPYKYLKLITEEINTNTRLPPGYEKWL
mgnify:CR=1 FL=1